MKTLYPLLLFILSIVVPGFLQGQSFETDTLSKNPIYAFASILQDYDKDGDLDIIACEHDPFALIWLENDSTQQFPRHVLVGEDITRPFDVDTADIDNDGDLDYVICSDNRTGNFEGELVWFQRQEDGTYIKWSIDVGKDFDEADVADFNGDGNIDIVAVGFDQDEVNVYLNDGNLNFTPKNVVPDLELNGQVNEVDAEDINGDGHVDIAFGDGNVNGRLYLNDGNANFTEGALLFGWNDLSASAGAADIEIVDLDRDGRKDILGFCGQGLGGIYFLDGSKSYDQELIDREEIDIGGDFVIADIDENGLPDIIRQHFGQKTLSILYQVDTLVFEKEFLDVDFQIEQDGARLAVGDLDGDGDLDVVVPEKRTIDPDFGWYENIDGKLYRHYIATNLNGVQIPKLADFDQDGDLDVFVTVSRVTGEGENEVLLYENINEQYFLNWRVHDLMDFPVDMDTADVDGDGDMDLFVTARDANDLVWLRNDGFQADWVADTIELNANAPLGIVAGLINDDPFPDVALCSSNDAKVFWYENDSSGSFTRRIIDANIPEPKEIEMADFNQDNLNDFMIICTDTTNSVVVYMNDSTGSFNREILYSGKEAQDIELGDWDNDGDMDAVVSFFNRGNSTLNAVGLLLLTNEGGGNFTPTPLFTLAELVHGILLRDVDNDDDLDVIMGYDRGLINQPGLITIGINDNGAINQTISLSDRAKGDVRGLAYGDIDGDDKAEIIYTDYDGKDLLAIDFTLDVNTAYAPVILLNALTVYPNPASTTLILDLKNPQVRLEEITLFDLQGRRLYQGNMPMDRTLDVRRFSGQLIFVSIKTNMGVFTEKVKVE